MTKTIGALLLCLITMQASAQKIVEKRVNLSSGGRVSLDIQIADDIRIITWDKNEAYIKASVNVNNNQNNDDYKWDFDESGGGFAVRAKFEDNGRNWCNNRNNNNCDTCKCNCICKVEIKAEVYIPANTDLTVETINGNITITGQTAQVHAKTISGFVDMTIPAQRAADVKLSTITGTMYSDLDLVSDKRNLRHVAGTSIDTKLNGGGSKFIRLETISGDIFLRKS